MSEARLGWSLLEAIRLNPYSATSPAFWRRHRAALLEFKVAYVNYLNDTLPSLRAGNPVPYDNARRELIHKAVRASNAVDAAEVSLVIYPPPIARPAPALEGLANVAFAHEAEPYVTSNLADPHSWTTFQLALEAMDQAEQYLIDREDEATRRLRSPFYWLDRGLRLILGLPGYLLSVVLGFDPRDLSATRGKVLWWVSVVADIAGIYVRGTQILSPP